MNGGKVGKEQHGRRRRREFSYAVVFFAVGFRSACAGYASLSPNERRQRENAFSRKTGFFSCFVQSGFERSFPRLS
jgi:hypothetical protein